MGTVELRTTAMAVGGEAVAREPSGRVVFVAGALAGELVRAELIDEKKAHARAIAVEVLEGSPDRVVPPCPKVAEGCGGCDWQHVDVAVQPALRRSIVADVLGRAGGIGAPVVTAGPALAAEGLRTTVRGVGGADGRFSFHRRRSHEVVAADGCLVAHPLVREVIDGSTFPPGATVTIRVGARTGDRLVVVAPAAAGTVVPPGVEVVGTDELRAGRRAWLHEEVAGRRWRVSAGSFFQASPQGAEALVSTVAAFVEAHAPDAGRLVDLCCGVGLLGGGLADALDTRATGLRLLGVERSASSVSDARHNLADLDARFVKVAMERWRPSPADVVVADPARSGLGAATVATVAATGASLCVLVSCDPGALGRDARLLIDAGFEHVGSTVVDLFGHSSHIEVVSGFRRLP